MQLSVGLSLPHARISEATILRSVRHNERKVSSSMNSKMLAIGSGKKKIDHTGPGMTQIKFYENSYQKELTATITGVDAAWIELNQTIFYPEGGGQPGDTGTLQLLTDTSRQFRILDTRKSETPGNIRHQLDAQDHQLTVGDEVNLTLDWDRRYAHMRMHTAMHLMGSLIPASVTGGQVGALKSRLDFDAGELVLDKETLTIEMQRLIDAAHDVQFGAITEAELDQNPGLVRTMSVQPPRGVGDIRMVRIPGVDYQPCGGTHINNTSEIGRIRVSKIENKGKQNRRVHLVFEEHTRQDLIAGT